MKTCLFALLLLSSSTAGAEACESDAPLKRAAKQLLSANAQPDSIALMHAVRSAGSEAIPVYAKYGPASEVSAFKTWFDELAKQADAPLVCGRATDGRRALWVVGVLGAHLKVLPNDEVRFALSDGFRRPRLIVRDNSGELVDLPLEGSGAQTMQIPAGMERPLLLQLVATGKRGPRPVAERWLGGTPSLAPDNLPRDDPEAWVAALRSSRKVAPLRSNRLLSAEANAHAATVCEAGQVAHKVEPDEDPEVRLQKRGVVARVVGEAIARAPSQSEAMRSLEQSPSHFDTLTDSRFTDFGVGVADDTKGRTCFVVLLAGWPRVVR